MWFVAKSHQARGEKLPCAFYSPCSLYCNMPDRDTIEAIGTVDLGESSEKVLGSHSFGIPAKLSLTNVLWSPTPQVLFPRMPSAHGM